MDPDERNRSVLDALREKGIKLTRQRVEIVRVLTHDATHPSARTLLKAARERVPDMSVSTVYSTLGLLKKEGLIKELEFYDMENRYESVMDDHVDLICTSCGRIANFQNNGTATREAIRQATGFEAQRMRHEYYGLCEKCRGGEE